jgi:hypothetical protein
MKNITVVILVVTLLSIGCAKQKEPLKLTKGTPAYQLALDLSKTLPSLDPEIDFIIVSTHGFSISATEVIQALLDDMGSQTDQLKGMAPDQLEGIIIQNAERMAERKLLLKGSCT